MSGPLLVDRCAETTTTTGTGTVTLLGAKTGYQSFAAVGNANTCYYTIAGGSEWEVGIGTYTASGTTLSRDTILSSSNSNAAVSFSAGTKDVFVDAPATLVPVSQHIVEGRLTLSTGVPITTTDVTGATSVLFTPYQGNVVTLWNGSGWQPTKFAETSLALGTLTSGKPYDVFGFLSSGALALELLVWTNDTTRATAVTLQDGRYCKSGDKTRLHLGTFYTTSTTTTEDSQVNRYLWNRYNQAQRSLLKTEATTSWTYTTNTIRQANGSTANQLNYVTGDAATAVEAHVRAAASNTQAASFSAGVGVDSTTAYSGHTAPQTAAATGHVTHLSGQYAGQPGLGRHFLAWLEIPQAVGTGTWYGTTTIVGISVACGILGSIVM